MKSTNLQLSIISLGDELVAEIRALGVSSDCQFRFWFHGREIVWTEMETGEQSEMGIRNRTRKEGWWNKWQCARKINEAAAPNELCDDDHKSRRPKDLLLLLFPLPLQMTPPNIQRLSMCRSNDFWLIWSSSSTPTY